MKLLKFWNWIKSIFKHQKTEKVSIPDDDPYAMITHTTKTLGFRGMKKHNNRKPTRGRPVQYVMVGGRSKPIYHSHK